MKILYLPGDLECFHKLLMIKSLYCQVKNLFHLLAGEVCCGMGGIYMTWETTLTNLLNGDETGAHLTRRRSHGVLIKNF